MGGWGNKQRRKHSIRPAIVVFLQRGAGVKENFAIFFAEPIFAKGTNYTTNCLREDGPTALVVTTYPIYLIPHKDGPLALVAPSPGPGLEGGARPLTAPRSHKRPGAGPLIPERQAVGPTAWPLFPTHTCRGRCWGMGRGMDMGKSLGGSRGLGRSRVGPLP